MSDNKIIVRKKRKGAKKYDASKDEMGNLLPEAEVVTFTGSEGAQKLKKKIYNAQKKLSGARSTLSDILKRREARGK